MEHPGMIMEHPDIVSPNRFQPNRFQPNRFDGGHARGEGAAGNWLHADIASVRRVCGEFV